MNLNKINILEGPWVDKTYYSEILPSITAANIPIHRFSFLPINEVNNPKYWGGLRSSMKFNVAAIDYRHWFFTDEIFKQYVENIASIPFEAVIFSENPFDEAGLFFSESQFDKKLNERTRVAYDIIKKKQKTLLVSPSISFNSAHKARYLNYFVDNRNFFDIWNVQCCTDFKEQDIAFLSGFLTEVLSILPKNVWITKWSVPSCESKIENKQSIEKTNWSPISYNQASMKMRLIFNSIEKITKGNSNWFYVGLGPDAYSPQSAVPDNIWNPYSLYINNEDLSIWRSFHFTGGSDYKGKIKTRVLETLYSMCKERNV